MPCSVFSLKEIQEAPIQQQLLSSADNLCKQFGPRSGPTLSWSSSGSKRFDTLTLIVFQKEFLKKNDFEKSAEDKTMRKSLKHHNK